MNPKRIQKLMDKGVGWVNIHYAVDYLPQHGKRVLNWMGGYYEPDYSINPHWDAEIRSLPKHAITRGVKPFVLRDEWYYNMRFPEDMKGVTPILTAIPPDNTRGTKAAKEHPGRPEHMAWAYDRPDGGRGFGFTGGHFHRNWADEDFRRKRRDKGLDGEHLCSSDRDLAKCRLHYYDRLWQYNCGNDGHQHLCWVGVA